MRIPTEKRTLFRLWAGALGVAALLVTPAPADYREVEITDGGTISGKVTFSGPLPEDAVETIEIRADTEVCGTGFRKIAWIDVKDGALRGTFVFLDGIEQGKKWPEPSREAYVLEQRDCRFLPWAQVVRPGPLTIRNSDEKILHNVHAREILGLEQGKRVRRTILNLAQPGRGEVTTRLEPGRSPFVAVNCEAHDFMFGFILTPEHPYATVVDAVGSFALAGVPPGTYLLEAWHPRLGIRSTRITVPPDGTVEVVLEYRHRE